MKQLMEVFSLKLNVSCKEYFLFPLEVGTQTWLSIVLLFFLLFFLIFLDISWWRPIVMQRSHDPSSNSQKADFIIWQAPRAGSMRRILCSDWLPERARWSDTARPGLPVSFPQIKFRQSSSECTKVFSR